jgi:putative endonuclease
MGAKSDPSTWSDARHRLGYDGEKAAEEYLKARGWQILAHRFRMGRLEVDLVARRGSLVAFIEVKTRWSRRFGSPLEAVTWTKRREIERVAAAWMDRYGTRGTTYRFDVIGVSLSALRGTRIEHVEDAFRVGWR